MADDMDEFEGMEVVQEPEKAKKKKKEENGN